MVVIVREKKVLCFYRRGIYFLFNLRSEVHKGRLRGSACEAATRDRIDEDLCHTSDMATV
ncbi:hypothetical protein SK128_000014, partial [Halocaridina rubra]